ncbi:MFS transporter [Actinocrinis sp.]|uniref:MFS transporter n=1 Tax=Actinocrinis sp. TaxID=1920516 RepID=UPI002D23FAB2|nr:MFS transporter [Actinocrinis sp.]HZP49554.1 MFS transporter [Actinocrinis sp.]
MPTSAAAPTAEIPDPSAHTATASSAASATAVADAPGRPRRAFSRFAIDTRPLRHPAYRRLWSSNVITSVGSQLTAVAVPKQIYDVTGSSTWIGIASFAALAPLVVFGLWGGAVADAVDRRKLLLTTNAGIAVTSIAFWAQAAAGLHSVWPLIVLLAAQQGLFGVNSAARGSAIPRLVPEEELPAANSLGATVMLAGALFGPMVAGALIPIIGLSTLYLLDAVGLTATLWAVYRLPALPPLKAEDSPGSGLADPNAPVEARRTGWAQVADGFRFVAANRLLLNSFVVDLIAMVFGMPRALFPQMAATTYASNHLALGLLFAAMPAGALVGGLLSGTYTRVRRHGAMTIGAVAAWGLAMLGLGLSGSILLACLFLAIGGVADFVSMVFRGSILQMAAPDEMRGRMQGVFTVVVAGGPRLADLVHGIAGAALGTRTAVAAGGLAVVAGVVILATFSPTYWRYRANS